MTRSLAAAISQMRTGWLILAAMGIQAPVLAQGIPAGTPTRQAYKHGYTIRETFDRFENRTTVELPYLWSDVDGSDHVQTYVMTPRFSYPGQSLPASLDSVAVQIVFDTELEAERDKRTGELDREMPFAERGSGTSSSCWTERIELTSGLASTTRRRQGDS